MRNSKGQFIKGIHPEKQFKKGQTPWNKGLKGCYKQSKKTVENTKKRWLNPEYKKKMSEIHKGYKMTEKQKIALSKRVKDEWDSGKRKGGWNKKNKTGKILRCKLCKKKKYFTLSQIENGEGKYCSRGCWGDVQRETQKGSNSHLWQGGKTEKGKTERARAKYRKWRSDVFRRDNWTCQTCNIRGCYLEAHHIKSWAKHPELRYVLSNGQTLCLDCHKLTNNYKGKNNGYL